MTETKVKENLTKIETERLQVFKKIEGESVGSLLEKRAKHSSDQIAYVEWKNGDRQREFTWGEVWQGARLVAARLRSEGLKPGDIVLVHMATTSMHPIADYGILLAGGAPCSLYLTVSDPQISGIMQSTKAKFAITDIQSRLDRIINLSEDNNISGFTLGAETQFSDVTLERHQEASTDIATLIFTSGTTGKPKGIPLTQENVLFGAAGVDIASAIEEGVLETYISYLPLSHVLERGMSIYLPLIRNRQVHFLSNAAELPATLRAVQPGCFVGTPRVFEKIMAGLHNHLSQNIPQIALAVEARQKAILDQAEAAGSLCVTDIKSGPDLIQLRQQIGLGNAEIVGVGAAYTPIPVSAYFLALGVPITEGYGLSETSMMGTTHTAQEAILGSIGKAQPGLEMRTVDGEIQVRGPSVFAGYFGNEGHDNCLDDEGWFSTGDLGRVDEDGNWFITGRRKELIITSSGKNITPNPIEAKLCQSPLVENAMVVGEGRSYLNALFSLSEQGQAATEDELGAHVDVVNETLSRIEQIKHFHVTSMAWTADSGHLTPTFKLRRAWVSNHHRSEIDALYLLK